VALPKGRKPGQVNKLTRSVREQMTAFVEGISQEELRKLWLEVKKKKPEEALKVYTRMCEYFVPKQASVTLDPGASGKPFVIEKRVHVFTSPEGETKKDDTNG
jgi:hypothetical protein